MSNIQRGTWRKSGFIVLFAATGLTLTWAAIEKFAYLQWSYALLRSRPDMLMRMQPETYMRVAGFVEFDFAFVLLGAASVTGGLAMVKLS